MALGPPFLAIIFHAIGLNVMNPSESKREILEASTRAVRDTIAVSWLRSKNLQGELSSQRKKKSPLILKHVHLMSWLSKGKSSCGWVNLWPPNDSGQLYCKFKLRRRRDERLPKRENVIILL